jgi:hypothetical protein
MVLADPSRSLNSLGQIAIGIFYAHRPDQPNKLQHNMTKSRHVGTASGFSNTAVDAQQGNGCVQEVLMHRLVFSCERVNNADTPASWNPASWHRLVEGDAKQTQNNSLKTSP